MRRFHVVLDVVDGLGLIVGLLVGETVFEAASELAVAGEGVTGHGLAGRVEGEQLAGHLGHRLASARLDGLPGGAAEAVERRRGAARPDVARDLADLVVGHEELVLLLEAQEEVVAGDAGHRARLDAREQGDAVIFVDDVVVGAQVEERGEAGAADEARPRGRRTQQAVLADHGQLELARDEAFAQRRRDEVDARVERGPGGAADRPARGGAGAGRRGGAPGSGAIGPGPVLAQLGRLELGDDQALHAVAGAAGLAGVTKDDEDPVAVVGQAAQVAFGRRDVAPGRLRPGGVELDALLSLHELDRDRVGQQTAGLEQRQVEPFAQLAGQGGGELAVEAGERAHDIVGADARQAHAASLADGGQVDEAIGEADQGARLGPPVGLVGRLVVTGELPRGELLGDGRLHRLAGRIDLDGRRDQAGFGLGHGALREHREAPQRLHGVAPELRPDRVAGRGIDIDKAAAHGELAALAHLLGALVAQTGEPGEHVVEGDLGALLEAQRPGLQGERDEALEEGDGVGDDHAVALLERAERPLPLTQHVRRRRHVGAVEHAARRQRLDIALEVHGQVAGQAGRLLGVGHDHEPARRPGRADQAGQHVGRVEARGVERRAAAQRTDGLAETLAACQVVEEHRVTPLQTPGDTPKAPARPAPGSYDGSDDSTRQRRAKAARSPAGPA